MMGVYYVVVTAVFGRLGEDYAFKILAGLVCWQWFARSLMAGTKSITSSATLLAQTRTPILLLTLPPVCVNGLYSLPGFLIVLIVAGLPSIGSLIWLPALMTVQFVLTLALSNFGAVLNSFWPDTERLLSPILRAWWFFSPILYPAERVREADINEIVKLLFEMNPFVWLVSGYQAVLIDGVALDFSQTLYWFGVSAALLALSVTIMYRTNWTVIKNVQG